MTTTFRIHAWERAAQRLRILPEEVLRIIDANLVVLLGQEQSSNRLHLLFYSEPDDACFVAIKDVKTEEIITILPINYHNRWKISLEAELEARKLCEPATPASDKNDQQGKYFYVRITIRQNGHKLVEQVRLKKQRFYCSPAELYLDREFCLDINSHLNKFRSKFKPQIQATLAVERINVYDAFDAKEPLAILPVNWCILPVFSDPSVASVSVEPRRESEKPIKPAPPPVGFMFMCKVRDASGAERMFTIGGIPRGTYGHTIAEMQAHPGVKKWLSWQFEKIRRPGEFDPVFFIREGHCGHIVSFET